MNRPPKKRLIKRLIVFALMMCVVGAAYLWRTKPENAPASPVILMPEDDPPQEEELPPQPEEAPAPQQEEPAPQPEEPSPLPEGFVYTADIVPGILQEIRYYSAYNFVGARIDGYLAPVSIMTLEAAEALRAASEILAAQGYVIKVYDSYRPADAVAHFVRWGGDLEDDAMKAVFYPDVDKTDLFSGYIASRSGHSRGSTVDLTLVELLTGKEADMGSPFDFLGAISRHGAEGITPEQAASRLILRNAMEAAGFKAYSAEWWHYTLRDEPFPDVYFNFPVK